MNTLRDVRALRLLSRATILDRYLLSLVLKPLAIGVGVLLIALLLGRVLRLVNILASTGSTEFGLLAVLTASLVPHYLGLAITAAFVVGVFVAMIRLGDNSELDALLSSGLSLRRIAVPFVALGAVLAVLSFLLYGWLNPLSRYDYRAVLHGATDVVTRTDLQPGTFLNAGKGTTITADALDVGGRRLEGIFIHQEEPDGTERITTASSGEIALGDDGVHLKLILADGISVLQGPNGAAARTQFKRLNFQTEIEYAGRPFRARGDDERELTFTELWRGIFTPVEGVGERTIQAELVDRIVRPLSLVLMPLLAIPLSLATKRGSRATGLIAAAILLVTFNNALQLGKDLASAGHGPAALTVGGPFLAFAVLSVLLFASAMQHPTQAPLSRFFDKLARSLSSLTGLFRKPRRRAA